MAPKVKQKKKMIYPSENKKKAYALVKERNATFRKAARLYKLSHSTLQHTFQRRLPHRMEERTILSKEEEQQIVDWLRECANRGHKRSIHQARQAIQTALNGQNATTRFKNNLPGIKWLKNFFERHPELSLSRIKGYTPLLISVKDVTDITETDNLNEDGSIHLSSAVKTPCDLNVTTKTNDSTNPEKTNMDSLTSAVMIQNADDLSEKMDCLIKPENEKSDTKIQNLTTASKTADDSEENLSKPDKAKTDSLTSVISMTADLAPEVKHQIKRTYISDNMEQAHTLVKEKEAPIREAVERTILSMVEEQQIVDWLRECANRGYKRSIHQVQQAIQAALNGQNATTHFRDNLPGITWLQKFVERHPELSLIKMKGDFSSSLISVNDVTDNLKEDDSIHPSAAVETLCDLNVNTKTNDSTNPAKSLTSEVIIKTADDLDEKMDDLIKPEKEKSDTEIQNLTIASKTTDDSEEEMNDLSMSDKAKTDSLTSTIKIMTDDMAHKAKYKGRRTILSMEEEQQIVDWLRECANSGHKRTIYQVRLAVQAALNEQNANTPFKDNLPGMKWLHKFLNRHPELILIRKRGDYCSSLVSVKDVAKNTKTDNLKVDHSFHISSAVVTPCDLNFNTKTNDLANPEKTKTDKLTAVKIRMANGVCTKLEAVNHFDKAQTESLNSDEDTETEDETETYNWIAGDKDQAENLTQAVIIESAKNIESKKEKPAFVSEVPSTSSSSSISSTSSDNRFSEISKSAVLKCFSSLSKTNSSISGPSKCALSKSSSVVYSPSKSTSSKPTSLIHVTSSESIHLKSSSSKTTPLNSISSASAHSNSIITISTPSNSTPISTCSKSAPLVSLLSMPYASIPPKLTPASAPSKNTPSTSARFATSHRKTTISKCINSESGLLEPIPVQVIDITPTLLESNFTSTPSLLTYAHAPPKSAPAPLRSGPLLSAHSTSAHFMPIPSKSAGSINVLHSPPNNKGKSDLSHNRFCKSDIEVNVKNMSYEHAIDRILLMAASFGLKRVFKLQSMYTANVATDDAEDTIFISLCKKLKRPFPCECETKNQKGPLGVTYKSNDQSPPPVDRSNKGLLLNQFDTSVIERTVKGMSHEYALDKILLMSANFELKRVLQLQSLCMVNFPTDDVEECFFVSLYNKVKRNFSCDCKIDKSDKIVIITPETLKRRSQVKSQQMSTSKTVPQILVNTDDKQRQSVKIIEWMGKRKRKQLLYNGKIQVIDKTNPVEFNEETPMKTIKLTNEKKD